MYTTKSFNLFVIRFVISIPNKIINIEAIATILEKIITAILKFALFSAFIFSAICLLCSPRSTNSSKNASAYNSTFFHNIRKLLDFCFH